MIPTPCLPCQLLCGWVCTVKGWVVFESLILAGSYFAAAYALREVVFPSLKSLFENVLVYQIPGLRHLFIDWIADVKLLFWGALCYVGIGLAGMLGAIFQVQILLWIYAAYLLVTLGINAKKLWDVLQSILGALDDLKKACDVFSAPFGGNCDAFFKKVDYVMYGSAGFIFLCQSLTLVCTCVLIRRNWKKMHALFFTFSFCGCTCGDKRRTSDSHDLEKAIPVGRRRRGVARTLLPAVQDAQDEKAALRARVAAIPRSSFELGRARRKTQRPELELGAGAERTNSSRPAERRPPGGRARAAR